MICNKNLEYSINLENPTKSFTSSEQNEHLGKAPNKNHEENSLHNFRERPVSAGDQVRLCGTCHRITDVPNTSLYRHLSPHLPPAHAYTILRGLILHAPTGDHHIREVLDLVLCLLRALAAVSHVMIT